MKTHIGLTIAGLLLSATAAQAGTASLSLGVSSQNFTEYGLGNDTAKGTGFSLWDMQQGNCATASDVTTCTLSGSYTSTVTGINSGTWSFVTSYDGAGPNGTTNAGPNAPIGVAEIAGSNYFNYARVTASTNMVLTLDMGPIDLVEEMVSGGKLVTGADFSFLFQPVAGISPCSGVSIAPAGCGPNNVGQVPGAIYSAPATMSVSFAYTPTPPVTTPEPGTLGLMGLSGLAMLGARRRRKTAA